MANSLDAATLLSIAKNRNRLLRLAEGIKSKKKSSHKKSLNLKKDPAYTNIEHLVFGTYRPRSSTPVSGKPAEQSRITEQEQDGEGPPERYAHERPPHQCECQKHSPHKRPPDGSSVGGSDRVSLRQPVAETIDDRYFDRSISAVTPGCSPSLNRAAADRSNPHTGGRPDLSEVSASITGFPTVINGLNTSSAVFRIGTSRAPLAADEVQQCRPGCWTDDFVSLDPASLKLPAEGSPSAQNNVLHGHPTDEERCEERRGVALCSAPCGGDGKTCEHDVCVKEARRGSGNERIARVRDSHLPFDNACDQRVSVFPLPSTQQDHQDGPVNHEIQDWNDQGYSCHDSSFMTVTSNVQLNNVAAESTMEKDGGLGRSSIRSSTPASRDGKTDCERANGVTRERDCKSGTDCLTSNQEVHGVGTRPGNDRRNGAKNHMAFPYSNGTSGRTDALMEQSRFNPRTYRESGSRDDRNRPNTLGGSNAQGDTSATFDCMNSPRSSLKQTNQRSNRMSPVSPRGNHDKINFQRQKSYPSGIPRPKFHMKHALVPMKSAPLPQSSHGSTDHDQYYGTLEDVKNERGDYNSVTSAWTAGEVVGPNSPSTSSAFVPFRKASSLCEKSKIRPVNMPIIRNSVPVKKLETDTKANGLGMPKMASTGDRRHPPTAADIGRAVNSYRSGKTCDPHPGTAGRWSVRATSAERNNHFKKNSSRSSFCGSNLPDAKTNCSSRSSLSSSRSSLNGSRSNLTCPQQTFSQGKSPSRGKGVSNGQVGAQVDSDECHYAVPTGIPLFQNGRPHIPEKKHPVSRIPATNTRGGLQRVRPVQTNKEAKEMQKELQEMRVSGSNRECSSDGSKIRYRRSKGKNGDTSEQKRSYSVDKNTFRLSKDYFPTSCNGNYEWREQPITVYNNHVDRDKDESHSRTFKASHQTRTKHQPPVRSISLDNAVLSSTSNMADAESDLSNNSGNELPNNPESELPITSDEHLEDEEEEHAPPVEAFGGDILEESMRTLEALSVSARQSNWRMSSACNPEQHTTSSSSTGELDTTNSPDVRIGQSNTDSPCSVGRTSSNSLSWSPKLTERNTDGCDKLRVEVAPDGNAIWMSDIEEKDENSSSSASRANSEEPPEMSALFFDSSGSFTPRHGNILLLKKCRLQSSGKGKDSLGLERLLPIGSSTRLDDSLLEIETLPNGVCVDGFKMLAAKSCAENATEDPDDKHSQAELLQIQPENIGSQNTSVRQRAMGAGQAELDSQVVFTTQGLLLHKMTDDPILKESLQLESSRTEAADKKLRISPSKLIRNRPISRSERELKTTSSPDFQSNSCEEVGKSVQDVIRPWSQVYGDLEDSELLHRSSSSSGSIQILKSYSDGSAFLSSEEQSPLPDAFAPRSNSLHTPSSRFSSADSVLQKFRKSFSLRFQRSRKCNSPTQQNVANNEKCTVSEDIADCVSSGDSSKDSSFQDSHLHSSDNLAQIQKTDLVPSVKKEEEISGFRIGSLLLRSSKEKKRGVPSKDGTSSKCNSADSGIQVEVPYMGNEEIEELPPGPESPAVVRRRTASASESSPKAKPPNRPHSDSSGSSGGNMSLMEAFMTQLSRQKECEAVVRRNSDSGQPGSLRKTPSVERQLSTPSFIKMRTERSRPQIKQNKGRVCLRRSISQPLDLEKLGLLHKTANANHDNDISQEASTASSDDEYSSEGECYQNRVSSRGQPLFRELSDDGVTYAEALWDHVTIDPEELAFQAGEVIEVTDSSDKDWWWGSIDNSSGWFPAAFVRLRVNQEDTVEDCINKMADGTLTHQAPRKMSVSLLSNEQVRANVVQEIVSTERDFVQHLRDVVEGYLRQVRRRPDMFSDERVATIFGNIEQIFRFQSRFLKKLEACIDQERPHASQIGNCFLDHKEEFEIYSEYCNNHPLAVSELQELFAESKYLHFFEACRLLREMIDISLDGFLLTPVQKICKYPLQLAELLKYTKADHPDHQPVADALAAMREVAQLVNERKRRMECLERLAEWQRTIDNWEGPDLLDTSSLLIYSGEVTRASSAWSRDLHMFLFDHMLIYCKRDLLKRNNFVYKGRINMDTSHVLDVEDGRDSQLNVTVKNAWKLYSAPREKWFLFYTKTSAEKDQWLQAFIEERQKVHEDQEQGFVVTEEAKKAARLAMMNKLKPKRPRAKLPKGPRPHPDTAVAELLLDPPCPKTRSGSLPSNLNPSLVVAAGARHCPPKKKGSGWFHFGSSKKPKK